MIHTNDANIFVASMWRSGSTHIAHVLGRSLGWRMASTAGFHGEGVEQQLVNPFSAAILFPYGYQVFLQHTWGTRGNVDLLRGFNVRTVVVYRNIPDVLVSIRERVLKVRTFVIPGLVIPAEFEQMNQDQQEIYLAQVATPWLLQFYATWQSANVEKCWVRYEDFYRDQMVGFRKLLYEMDVPEPDGLAACIDVNHNFNVGKSGRGAALCARAKQSIDRHVDAWPLDRQAAFRKAGLV